MRTRARNPSTDPRPPRQGNVSIRFLSRMRQSRLGLFIIAKLDRIARYVVSVAELMESGVEFVAVDFPATNRLTIHMLAPVAEHENDMISVAWHHGPQATCWPARPRQLGEDQP